jgi:hypothetical protein
VCGKRNGTLPTDQDKRDYDALIERLRAGVQVIHHATGSCVPVVDDLTASQAMRKAAEAISTLLKERDALRNHVDDLQQAEFEYRLMHDRYGDGASTTGRAWDLMKRAGDKARAALSTTRAIDG